MVDYHSLILVVLFIVLPLSVVVIADRIIHRRIAKAIDADWSDFELMSAKQLKDEWERLLVIVQTDPRCDRFRRICQFIAVRWSEDKLPK